MRIRTDGILALFLLSGIVDSVRLLLMNAHKNAKGYMKLMLLIQNLYITIKSFEEYIPTVNMFMFVYFLTK